MKILINVLIALVFFMSFPLRSDNYSFLDDTAGQYFNEQDWAIYLKAQNLALNQYRDGSKLTWRNPATGSHGSFVPMNTMRKNGLLCRNLKIENNANYRTGVTTLTFCKNKGEWKGI